MEGPEVHAPHPPHTGVRWWDYAIGGTALLVSLISLYVAIHHGTIMERLVAANSWPNVSVDTLVTRGESATSGRLAIIALNNGIGPARVESFELWVGKTPVPDARGLVNMIKATGGGDTLIGRIDGSTIIGAVVGVGEKIDVFSIEVTDARKWAEPMIRTVSAMQSRVCYCSVFDECYVADSRARPQRPERVEKCPVPAVPFNDAIGDAFTGPDSPAERPAAPAGR